MHHKFRVLLATFLKDNGWTQQNLADKLDTDQATVSRWLSGRVEVSAEAVQKLLEVVPEGRRSELLEAYLKDKVPQGMEHYIQLGIVESPVAPLPRLSSEAPEFPEVLDASLKKRLVFFCNLALQSAEVRKLIDLVYRLASSKKR